MHVVLLGDSIFDNGAYTRGEPDVITHLRALLPSGARATLAAVDGSTTGDIDRQVARAPADASHLVLAVGGNDALGSIEVLSRPAATAGGALLQLDSRLTGFEASYAAALDRVLLRRVPTCVCTIYNGNFQGDEASMLRRGVALFNDVILLTAFRRGVPVIELRLVCSSPEDYANPIEPSGNGGRKIARAIARATGTLQADRLRMQVIVD
jgi:hypothetical protein